MTAPCASEGRTSAPNPGTVNSIGLFKAANRHIRSLALWGSRVAYLSGGLRTVVVCDLRAGKASVVAEAPRNSQFGSVVGDGDTIVWTVFRPKGTGSTLSAQGEPWSIYARDLEKAETTQIASGEPRGGHYVSPSPEIDWPYVAWLDLPATADLETRGPELVVYDLRTASRRIVASGNFPGSGGITDGRIYFDAKTESGGRDLYAAPVDGSSPPVRLTNEGTVIAPRVGNGWITWLRFPATRDLNVPLGDVPVMALKAGSTTSTTVGSGKAALPGAGYVLIHSVEAAGLQVAWINGEKPPTVLATQEFELGAGWAADENRIAWMSVDDPLGKRAPAFLNLGHVS